MLSLRRQAALSIPAILVVAGSCTMIDLPGDGSPLVPPRMSPDSCALDIFIVRVPFGDPEVNGSMWDEVDEQHFPTDLRRQLAQRGFRVGLVGGHVPAKIAQLLELVNRPVPSGQSQEIDVEDLGTAPTVVPRHLQLRADKRCEVVTSGDYDEVPVFTSCGSGGLGAKSYRQAQCVMALKSFPEPDGRVRLELVPELHHGQRQTQFVGGGAVGFRVDRARPRLAFDDVAVSATLKPGDMLLVSSLPSRRGRLGHHFFTHEQAGSQQQKLLLIRLSQTQHDGLFSSANAPPSAR
ncbi:MAG: hypothetical protein ACYTG0_33670 [Planctomycetota bacterium]|jgi:hypothetical protein